MKLPATHYSALCACSRAAITVQDGARLNLRGTIVDAVRDDVGLVAVGLAGDVVRVVNAHLGEGDVRLGKPLLGMGYRLVVELSGVLEA